MAIDSSLYKGKLIRFASIDFEKDPEVMARWSHDTEYLLGIDREPIRPLSAAAIRKSLEKKEKNMDEKRNMVYMTIRSLKDDHLLGFTQMSHIEFHHRSGVASLAVGCAEDRHLGYGSEALRLLLQFSFQELNLYRVTAWTDEHNIPALQLFKKTGFMEEVRRRQAFYAEGRYWDVIHLGILREEWESTK